jgi:hypothetical protein
MAGLNIPAHLMPLFKKAQANHAYLMDLEKHGPKIEMQGSAKTDPTPKPEKKAKVVDFTQEELVDLGRTYVEEWLPSKKQMTRIGNLKKPTEAQIQEEDEWALVFHNADKVIGPLTEGQRVRAAAAYRKGLKG